MFYIRPCRLIAKYTFPNLQFRIDVGHVFHCQVFFYTEAYIISKLLLASWSLWNTINQFSWNNETGINKFGMHLKSRLGDLNTQTTKAFQQDLCQTHINYRLYNLQQITEQNFCQFINLFNSNIFISSQLHSSERSSYSHIIN